MDILEIDNLVSAADPGGLATYAAVMAVFLGSVALARLRDDALERSQARLDSIERRNCQPAVHCE
jgi:hypothetical protein